MVLLMNIVKIIIAYFVFPDFLQGHTHSGTPASKMTTNISGIISVVFFYIIILLVGIWAGKKKKSTPGSDLEESEEVMLAGRNIGMFVGIFTMTGESFPSFLLSLFS